MKQTYIEKMTGYKATDKNMCCRDQQFTLGEWSPEIDGDLKLCERGYHFCVSPSGVWAYYTSQTTRIFKIEAENVLECPTGAGADFKLVARRIRLVEEITPGKSGDDKSNTGYGNTGDSNTGYGNTGDSNTGNSNTGNRNTGNSNTGYGNTGDSNTGDNNTGNRNTGYGNTGNHNTGYGNTGYGNTGDSNIGNRNTGYGNTGDSNTGYGNTGDSNTGNRNTGYGNAANGSAGFFCSKEPKVICFDAQTKLTRDQFTDKYPEYRLLCEKLVKKEVINFADFKHLPGITKKKLAALHKKHLAARK